MDDESDATSMAPSSIDVTGDDDVLHVEVYDTPYVGRGDGRLAFTRHGKVIIPYANASQFVPSEAVT